MKFLFFLLLAVLSACSFEHVAEIRLQNNNPYPIQIQLVANNIQYSSDTIKPSSKFTHPWSWSQLNNEDGHLLLTVRNTTTGQIDSFLAGTFTNGTLSNYIDITLANQQAQITLSD